MTGLKGEIATFPRSRHRSGLELDALRNLVLSHNHDDSDISRTICSSMILCANMGQSWTLGISSQPWRRCVVRKPLSPKRRWIIGLLKRTNGNDSGKLLVLQK